MKDSFNKLLKHLLAFVPTKLPTGVAEFHTWADEIIEYTDLPNNDSMKFALAGIITQFKPDKFYVSKFKLSTILLKGAANQVAGHIFYELKQKQAEEAAKAKEQQQIEADTKEKVASNDTSNQV